MSKGNIQIETIDDWDNLRYKLNKYFAHFPDYIFRGQGQEDWLLESTLTRALKKVEDKDKTSIVKSHYKRFTLEIRGRRGPHPRQLTENEIWALGQHFGLHTPLLDWTASPWTAIFFSLLSPEKSETGYRALWALNTGDFDRINASYKKKYSKSGKYTVELVEPNIDENNRLVSQRGLFTKLDVTNDIEKWVTKASSAGNWITLYKFIFPDHLRERVLLYLNLMNINYSSLFPDLLGSSQHVNVQLQQHDLIQGMQRKEWDDKLDDEE
jgi:hypothetical protein